ncbi:MAG TPA: hypothetical protein VIX62_05200 [Actinomycetota bacterium]
MSDHAPPVPPLGPQPADVVRADAERVDLDRIERELRDVETALARLADGTYWSEPGALVPGTRAPGLDAPDH